jgi:carboxyl-terminal processing protease
MKGDVGYIRLSAFHERTSDEMGAAMRRLLDAGARSLILDLRNNPGGLLRQSVRVAERFLPEKSMVVFTRGRHRSQTMYFRTHGTGIWARKPLIVLVNKGSASASEIVAGAVKDLDRGLLIGRKTFGKGSVQTIIPISGGSGIRMTTAKYYTPLGIGIHGKGIRPDIEAGPPPNSKKNQEKKDQAKAPKALKEPRKLPKKLDDPTFGDDDIALQVALRTLKRTKSSVVEVLRLTALQVQSRMARLAKRNSHAQAPGGQSLRP